MIPNRPRYAARLNAFKLGLKNPTVPDLLARIAEVPGIDAADLNFPDHFEGIPPATLSRIMADHGIALNGVAMRYYTDPGFRLGAFSNPDAKVRQAAVDITKRGLDAMAEMGGKVMTLWMGQDGVDYAFQGNYARMWDDSLECLAQVCDHNPALDVSLEYKPNEPRAFSLMPDIATNLLAIKELGRANTGITLDFCHVLFAGEIPAQSAQLAGRYSRILGVHLNDGYGKRDDGLMVASVHEMATLELLRAVKRGGYDGAIYFDTFPDASGLDPVAECAANIRTVKRLLAAADRMEGNNQLAEAQGRQDPVLAHAVARGALDAFAA